MLTIRDAQMRELSRVMAGQFQKRAEEHAWARFPEPCAQLGEVEVRNRVASMMRKAAGFGLEAESDYLSYLEFMFVLSPDFDERLAWAGEVLRHPHMPGPQKMGILFKRYQYELAAGAAPDSLSGTAGRPDAPVPRDDRVTR